MGGRGASNALKGQPKPGPMDVPAPGMLQGANTELGAEIHLSRRIGHHCLGGVEAFYKEPGNPTLITPRFI